MNPGKLAFIALALGLSLAGAAHGQAVGRKQVTLGVGGKTSLYYLPLTICERLGYFKEQGLDVAVNDFRGGAQSLQALVGGSVDVVTGAYEHTIRMQVKGQDIRAVIELGRFPGIAVGVRKERAESYKSPADLKGMKIGVSAPGSSTNFLVMYLMSKAGVKPADASYIGVGIGPSAVAAIKKGEIDALSNVDPMITKLEQDGDIKVVADTRSEEIRTRSRRWSTPFIRRSSGSKAPHRKTSRRLCRRNISSATRRSTLLRSKPIRRSIPEPASSPPPACSPRPICCLPLTTSSKAPKSILARRSIDRFVKKAAAGK